MYYYFHIEYEKCFALIVNEKCFALIVNENVLL